MDILIDFYFSKDDMAYIKQTGSSTERLYSKMVKEFQRRNMLVEDGAVGKETRPVLVDLFRNIGPFNGTKPVFDISYFNAFLNVLLVCFLISALFMPQPSYAEEDPFINYIIHSCTVEIDSGYWASENEDYHQLGLDLIDQNWGQLCPEIDHVWLEKMTQDEYFSILRKEYYDAYLQLINDPYYYLADFYSFSLPLDSYSTTIRFVIESPDYLTFNIWSIYYQLAPESFDIIGSSDFGSVLDIVEQHYNSYISQNNTKRDKFVEIFGEEALQFDNFLYRVDLSTQMMDDGESCWLIHFYQTFNGLYPYLSHNEWMIYTVKVENNEIIEADMENVYSFGLFPYLN